MKNYFLNFILASIVFVSIFIVFVPYFTSDFLDVRQKLGEKEERIKIANEAEERIYLTGRFNPGERENFALIPPQYTTRERNSDKMYLRKETLEAFSKMRQAALSSGVDLKIASATRNFDYQKNIWNNKWTGVTLVDGKNLSKSIPDGLERFKKILEYSSVPSTSRHHFGTDIDINNANLGYFTTKAGKEVYAWLSAHASSFGFCQTYTLKGTLRPTGYNEEKWHWSYLPISRDLTQKYKNLIKTEDITGFLGDEYVPSTNLINEYVLSINPDCI